MSHRSVRSLALFFSFIVVAVVCLIASFYYHTHTHTYTPTTLKGRYTKLRCSLIIRTPPREPFFSPVTVFGFYRRVRATIVIAVIAVIVGTARVCARVYLCNCLCGHACHILRSYSSLVLHRRPPPSSSSSPWSLAPERAQFAAASGAVFITTDRIQTRTNARNCFGRAEAANTTANTTH